METKRKTAVGQTTTVKRMCENDTTHNSRIKYNTFISKFQVVVFILFIGIMCVTISLSHKSQTSELIATEHKVRQGETLWSISAEYKPDCMTMDEYMSFVYENNKGGVIYPGDVVVVGVTK